MVPRIWLAPLLCASLAGQGQASLKMVDGHPLLRATLTSGDDTYEAHLLLDLSLPGDLLLHPMAAGALAPTVDLRSGGVHLRGLQVETRPDEWLEEMTGRHARALGEVPLVGMLGLSALEPYTFVLDAPGGELWLLPGAGSRPEPTPERIVVDLHLPATAGGIQVPVELADGTLRPFSLDTKNKASRIGEELAASLGNGRLEKALLGSPEHTLDLADLIPFQSGTVPLALAGTLGTKVLDQMVVTVHPRGGWLALERTDPRPFPEDEAAYYGLGRGAERTEQLAAFLTAWPDSEHRGEAARELFALALAQSPPNLEWIEQAAEAAVRSAREAQGGTVALELLAQVPDGPEWNDLREQIATAALPRARADRDPDSLRTLQLHLGVLAHERGDLREARRQLLSAVFAMPTDGAANLALGDLYETMGQPERARSRYFLALLQRDTRVEAWLALVRVHRQIGDISLAELLDEMADGRVPALHPLPRETAPPEATGAVVLVEVFTGAHDPYSVAADLAVDALAEQYPEDEIAVVRWHLPHPAPQPLVADVALDRAGKLEVMNPPLVRIGGQESTDGGGPGDAEALLARYQHLVDQARRHPPTATLSARAWLEQNPEGTTVHLHTEVTGSSDGLALHAVLVERLLVFPGQNDLLFHRQVARAALTPKGGVSPTQPYRTSASLEGIAAELERTFAGLIEQRDFPIRPSPPSPDNLAIVLYLEEPESGRVVQAKTVDVAPGRVP